jgi:lipopolysaccharide biosynthesis protein
MKRVALYAHYSNNDVVAKHVFYYLMKLREFGFQVCFISNSPISFSSEELLKGICERIIQRENVGYDFSMWQQGLSHYERSQMDELLLTNSSIIGPLQPLAPLWQNPAIVGCDFWGLTDNDELESHLQSYFLVFRPRVLQSARFMDFWNSILPYKDKQQLILSYEVGLTRWLEEGGFKWGAVFKQKQIISLFFRSLKKRSIAQKIRDRIRKRTYHPGRNTSVIYPDFLLQCGMPFLKAALLRECDPILPVGTKMAFQLLQASNLPAEIVEELRSSE